MPSEAEAVILRFRPRGSRRASFGLPAPMRSGLLFDAAPSSIAPHAVAAAEINWSPRCGKPQPWSACPDDVWTIAIVPRSWSPYVRLHSVQGPPARRFYEEESLRSGWSVRGRDLFDPKGDVPPL
jgi:hypothetical protein